MFAIFFILFHVSTPKEFYTFEMENIFERLAHTAESTRDPFTGVRTGLTEHPSDASTTTQTTETGVKSSRSRGRAGRRRVVQTGFR